MSFKTKQPTQTDPSLAGIDLSLQPTNQEVIPLTYAAGEYTIAAHWISDAYNQKAVEAPNSTPQKK